MTMVHIMSPSTLFKNIFGDSKLQKRTKIDFVKAVMFSIIKWTWLKTYPQPADQQLIPDSLWEATTI